MSKEIPFYFKSTYDNTPERVCITDLDNKILWVNGSFSKFLSWAKPNRDNNPVGINYFDLMRNHIQEDEFIISHLQNGIKKIKKNDKNCFTYEFPVYTSTGSTWFMLVACSKTDTETNNKYSIIKMYDITEHHNRRKLENKNDDNNIVRQIITESMHTWRQPLNSISLFAQDIKEQFDDNTLTKYYMNFSTNQMLGEIQRLSNSIDDMASFYTNSTDEDTINVSETLFSTVKKINYVLMNANMQINLDCHVLGNIQSESYIQLSDTFKIRCGTGTKKCFHGCHKGNILIFGDKVQYNYISRLLSTIGATENNPEQRNIYIKLSTTANSMECRIEYDYVSKDAKNTFDFIANLHKQSYKGNIEYHIGTDNMFFVATFDEYKTKSPI